MRYWGEGGFLIKLDEYFIFTGTFGVLLTDLQNPDHENEEE